MQKLVSGGPFGLVCIDFRFLRSKRQELELQVKLAEQRAEQKEARRTHQPRLRSVCWWNDRSGKLCLLPGNLCIAGSFGD